MSNDRFTSGPSRSVTTRHCPHCDAPIKDAHPARCWLCGASLTPAELTDRPSPSYNLVRPNRASGDNVGFEALGFGFLVLLLLLLISVALAAESPGVLLLLLVAVTPALIRTLVTTQRQEAEGQEVTSGRAALTFLSSVGVVAIVGLAAGAAFFATCFAVCLAGIAITDLRRGSEDGILVASVGAGLVPGIAIAILLFRAFWKRRTRP